MLAGTGTVYPAFPPYVGPNILNYNQSAELDGQFFFSGSPWEMVGRNYTAQTLNRANGGSLTQYDITREFKSSKSLIKVGNSSPNTLQLSMASEVSQVSVISFDRFKPKAFMHQTDLGISTLHEECSAVQRSMQKRVWGCLLPWTPSTPCQVRDKAS